ncbi:MAG: efflux RND transporter permease subunit [Bacteroidales bacterium]|nr:efflux RND transporter permease subunit [Bacteroidales bacterium]
MKKLVATFIQYPFYANLIIVITLLSGVYGLMSMKKSFFPERRSREIFVSVAYPGASPKEMEEGITVRIEEAVRGLVGIKEINSTSSENFARVQITTTGEYDIDATLQEVKNAVDGISSMPVDAERPIVFKQRNTTPAVRLGLASEGVDLMTLKKYAMQIEDDFRASGYITQMSVWGYPALEISVEISEQNRLRYNISFDEIEQAIRLNNSDISAGQIKSDEEEILIRSRKRSVDPGDIAEIIVRANPDGSFIRIRDIADVKLKFADVASMNLLNGNKAVNFYISKLVDEDLKQITDYIREYVEDFNRENEGMHLYVTFDFLNVLNARLNLLLRNGGIGIILVLLTLGFFLNIRLSFWVAFGIPFSFLGMFFLGHMFGITVNMISLFGMILVVGILVDDGIVIAENIYSHFEKGKTPRKAALEGSLEVLPAVLTSVTTTMIAFSPLLILREGRMEFMFQMAFVVIISLFFSLIEAFLVLPGHLGHGYILRSKDVVSKSITIRSTLDKIIAYMRDRIYGSILRWVIRWRWYVAGFIPIALILLTIGMFLGGIIKSTFYPVIPFDFFSIDIAFTPGSGEKQTWDYLMRFDSIVWEVNDELMEEYKEYYKKHPKDTISVIQFTYPGIGSAFDGVENGSHAGRIFVQPRDLEKFDISGFDIAHRIRIKIGQVPEAEKFSVGGSNRWGKPISLSLLGKDFDELELAENFLLEGMKNMEELENVIKTNAAGKREVLLKLKPKAYFLGLNHASISNQIRQGFFGGQAQRLQDGKDEIRVWVRYPKQDRETLGQMENMKIMTPRGEFPLSELATYEIKRGPVNINRFNMSREVRVESDLTDPYAPVPPVLESIDKNILMDLKTKFPGIRIQAQGQQRSSEESMQELIHLYIIAIVIIVFIVMLHFRSVAQSFIIILMIPLSWIGAVWGHGIEGIPVSMLSAWGMVALSGVIINDAVVFLSKYNLNLQEGMKQCEALYQAGISRFRPILLTTITTSVGLYPIILEKSHQAQFLKPMAVALAYGVLIGTGFILLFFPALIMFLNDVRVTMNWLWKGKRPAREHVEVAIRHMKIEKGFSKEQDNNKKIEE